MVRGVAIGWYAWQCLIPEDPPPAAQVNIPKQKKSYCQKCNKHQNHKVTQYKKGKDSLYAQGVHLWPFPLGVVEEVRDPMGFMAIVAGKRRYDWKQKGYGGQTKPVFRKKAKTTKKIVLRMTCQECKRVHLQKVKVSRSSMILCYFPLLSG